MAQGTAPGISDLATIGMSSKLPEFWADMPRMWFAQFEAVMAPQRQGDVSKYNLVIAKLGREALQQVSDLILSPPEEGKYEKLKERLLAVFEESAERQFQKLVSGIDLGAQRPSQLLRRMTDLARNTQVADEALKNLWLARLPSSVRVVLTVSQDTNINNLAIMADKIMENLRSGEVDAVTTPGSSVDLVQQMANMAIELQHLRGEINEIRARSYNRSSGSRARSRTPRRTPSSPDWLCRHHFRYRERARTCEEPCSWNKKQGN